MSGPPLLSLAGVTVRLGGRPVLTDLTLEAPAGTLLAVVGPNGAGKSSLLRALVGAAPWTGRIALGGLDLARLPRAERARRLSYLPQGHAAHWPLPARDIVALGRYPHGAGDPARLGAADSRAVEDAMRLTDTLAFADRPVTALSGGERARVALARVFAGEASVVLADEPTAALDPRHALGVVRALRRKADEGALTVVVTHDLGLAARFADRVAVLDGGRLAAAGPPTNALAPDLLARVFGIEAYRAERAGEPVLVPWAESP